MMRSVLLALAACVCSSAPGVAGRAPGKPGVLVPAAEKLAAAMVLEGDADSSDEGKHCWKERDQVVESCDASSPYVSETAAEMEIGAWARAKSITCTTPEGEMFHIKHATPLGRASFVFRCDWTAPICEPLNVKSCMCVSSHGPGSCEADKEIADGRTMAEVFAGFDRWGYLPVRSRHSPNIDICCGVIAEEPTPTPEPEPVYGDADASVEAPKKKWWENLLFWRNFEEHMGAARF